MILGLKAGENWRKTQKRTRDYMRGIDWSDLDIVVKGRLVLRHNKKLQYGYTPGPGETLHAALRHMQDYCKAHKDGNPKITGLIKVVEHARLNGVPLALKLDAIIVRARCCGE